MYTFENDDETSSRLHKHEILSAALSTTQPEKSRTSDEAEAVIQLPFHDTHVTENPSAPTQPDDKVNSGTISRQITGSFKELTQPSSDTKGNARFAVAALTVACISVFFTALDQTVVVTALPQMIVDLHISFTQLDHAAWIISAYLLGFVVAMPLMGRVSDIYGRRRIFLLCLIIFGIGSIGCGIAPLLGTSIDISFLGNLGLNVSSPSLVWLIAARLFQAIGGGAVVPIAMAIAGDFYGQERRGLALGIIGAVTEAGGALGPLYGALIVGRLGWQYIFYLNVPVVIALVVAAWFLIPRGRRRRERIDWLGAGLLAGALTCLSLGLAQQGTAMSASTATKGAPQNNPLALILAALFLLAFILIERKLRWPVVNLVTFKHLTFSASAIVSLLVGAALIIAMSDIPIYVDTVLQRPVLDSGLALLRMTVMIPIGAILGGWLCNRFACRLVGIVGLLFTAVGFFLMSRWPVTVGTTQMTISTMTVGLGFGLVISPIGTTTINAIPPSQAGMGSAVVTALRMVGMMLGLSLLTSWALSYFRQLAAAYPTLPAQATTEQFTKWSKGYAAHLIQSEHTVYTNVFFISMIICLLAIPAALFLWGKQAPVEEPAGSAASLYEDETIALGEIPAGTRTGWWQNRKRRRWVLASVGLAVLLVAGWLVNDYFFGSDDSPDDTTTTTASAPLKSGTNNPAVPASGPRMLQLALDKDALTSLFVSQLNLQQDVLSDLSLTPGSDDGLVLNLNLHITMSGVQRVLPVEVDSTIGLDNQQNIQFTVQHLKRDGQDAGADGAANMQTALNMMLTSSVMPTLREQLQHVKLVSVHTSTAISCGQGVNMFVLQIEAPAIQGIAAQPTPVPFCFKGTVDLKKLLPK